MKKIKSLIVMSLAALLFVVVISACNDPIGVEEPSHNNEVKAFMKLAENSPSINSFTPSYSDEDAEMMSQRLAKDFYPMKVHQKFTLTDKSLTLEKDSTTAICTYVQKFDGTLILAGSFQKETIGVKSRIDTVIEKSFSTTITRLIKFDRIDSTGNDTLDWKVSGVSLPAGGTEGDEIVISKITLTARDGSELLIDNPNTFFFDVGRDKNHDFDDDEENLESFGFGIGTKIKFWKKLHTWYNKNQYVKMSVEVISNTEDPDVLTITHGASMNGKHKSKENFELVSTVPEGDLFRKIYERTWKTDSRAGRKHVVINAIPRLSVYDSESPVVEKTWGVPYKVQ